MKRFGIVLVIIIILLTMLLSACNPLHPFGDYYCTGIHVTDSNGNCHDIYNVDVYYKETDGIKCYYNNYASSLFLPNGTYIPFSGKCPFCTKGDNND